MWLYMQQAMERLLGQFNKRTETLSHMQRLQLVLPRHQETLLFSMELGWTWHKFPDVAVWHRILSMTCWPQRLPTRTWQKMSLSTIWNLNSMQLFPLWSCRPSSKGPDIQPGKATDAGRPVLLRWSHTTENWSRRIPATRRQMTSHGQAWVDKLEAGWSPPSQDTSIKSTSEDATPCLYCCKLFSNTKSHKKWIKCGVCKAGAHENCAGYEGGAFICEMCDDQWLQVMFQKGAHVASCF